MESQFIWPLIGIFIVLSITCISATWMVSKAISELRGDIKVLDTRMDNLDKRMDGLDKRMDGLDTRMNGLEGEVNGLKGQVNGLKGEVHGINEFLRRKPTTEGEK